MIIKNYFGFNIKISLKQIFVSFPLLTCIYWDPTNMHALTLRLRITCHTLMNIQTQLIIWSNKRDGIHVCLFNIHTHIYLLLYVVCLCGSYCKSCTIWQKKSFVKNMTVVSIDYFDVPASCLWANVTLTDFCYTVYALWFISFRIC